VSHQFGNRSNCSHNSHDSLHAVTPSMIAWKPPTEALRQPRCALLHPAPIMCCRMSAGRGTLPLQENESTRSDEAIWRKICWLHLRVRSLSRGGTGGHCRHPADRVPLYACSKLGPETRCAMTRRHVSHGFRSRLPSRESSVATTCQIALSSLHRSGRLQCRHVPNCYGDTSPHGRASVNPRA
jgi:hypothetical protein